MASEAREHFQLAGASITRLEEKLDDSEFYEVHLGGPTLAIGRTWIDGQQHRTQIENDSEWLQLLKDAQIFGISKESGAYVVIFGVDPFDGETSGTMAYIHSSHVLDELIECQPAFEKTRCGRCVTPLAKDWWIDYRWFPDQLTDETYIDVIEGRLKEEEYNSLQDQARRDCVVEGYSTIGYELQINK